MIYRITILLVFFLFTSFLYNEGNKRHYFHWNTFDNISKVDILFYPSFHMSSSLQLDKTADLGIFKVKGLKKKLTFKLSSIDKQILISNFFNEEFVKSLRDTAKIVASDGMHIWLKYKNNKNRFTIDLGNVRPNRIDSILLQQIRLLDTLSKDQVIKAYLKSIMEYF